MALPNYLDIMGGARGQEWSENIQSNYEERNPQFGVFNTQDVQTSYLHGLYGFAGFQHQAVPVSCWTSATPASSEPPEEAPEGNVDECQPPVVSNERNMIMQLRDEVTSELIKFRELALSWQKEKATLKGNQRELSKQLTLAQDEATRLRREVAMLRVGELNWQRVGNELRNAQFQLREAAVKLKGKEQEIADLNHELRTVHPRLIRLGETERTVKKLEEEVQRLRPLERELQVKQQQIQQLQKEKSQIQFLRLELDACQRLCEQICLAAANAKATGTAGAPAGAPPASGERGFMLSNGCPNGSESAPEINAGLRRATL